MLSSETNPQNTSFSPDQISVRRLPGKSATTDVLLQRIPETMTATVQISRLERDVLFI